VGEQAAELVDGIHRVEADGAGVGANPRTRVEAAGPLRQVVVLERVEQFALDPGVVRNLVERDGVALAMAAESGDEGFLRTHLVSLTGDRAIPAPRTRWMPFRVSCSVRVT
jgi:hypothetical protein